MTSYTTIKQRERHATADRLIGQTYEIIQRSMAAQAVLGAEFLDHFHRFANNYYVPNERHGMYAPSEDAIRNDRHPVIVPDEHESYMTSRKFAVLSKEQCTRAYQQTSELGISGFRMRRVVGKALHAMPPEGSAEYQWSSPNQGGYVARIHALDVQLPDVPSERNLYLSTRPILTIQGHSSYGPVSPGELTHEIVHHRQRTTSPITDVPAGKFGHRWIELEHEYEAYAIQSNLYGMLDDTVSGSDSDSRRRALFAGFILQNSHLLPDWRDPIEIFNDNMEHCYSDRIFVAGYWYRLP